MKGTLSSTRVWPQIYSIRGAGRPAFPPRVSSSVYCTYSFRDICPELHVLFLQMPPFGNVRHPRLSQGSPFAHPLTRESCSASIRPMAKAHKPSSGSSRRTKGTARGQSKSKKKKTFPPPPPAQRGGVELVDPRVQAQLKVYDEALTLFHQQKFATCQAGT